VLGFSVEMGQDLGLDPPFSPLGRFFLFDLLELIEFSKWVSVLSLGQIVQSTHLDPIYVRRFHLPQIMQAFQLALLTLVPSLTIRNDVDLT